MLQTLKNLDIFSGFNDGEISGMEKYFAMKSYDKDATVAVQGELKKELYIISEGKIVSSMKLPGTIERKHGELSAGDFFGESSVFGNRPLFNTYVAAEKSNILIICEESFSELIEKNPNVATRFISGVLSRTIKQFRKSSSFLADVVQWGENASRRVITDELTGIYNRAFLDDAIENFFNISKSNNKPLSLLMLDLDNCRKINEELDLETGNKIITQFARIIQNIISKHGIAARYGGDEFSILLPETGLKSAAAIAEKIRSSVENYDFSGLLRGKNISVTTSIGISSFPETVTELPDFKTKADASLYRAKESGRNRVEHII